MKNSTIIETFRSNNNEEILSTYTACYCMYDMLFFAFDVLSDIEPSLTIIRTNK